ncbi:MAG: Holliday junction branch migration protein RuvA [Micrococcales bacterium]|nr:MAG: Holliday junction branch migration protein RuvA [Micrococcales bacterium]PIE26578.1 MAG: Holliday junction branch migration protein RuvA [Micrococcales bacterium]
MISSLRGTVTHVGLDHVVIEVGGVGISVLATPATLAGACPGQTLELATSLVVREDSLTLYGFAGQDEREVFQILQLVSGVGPRLALATLAVHSPDAVRDAVAKEDVAVLTAVPGIGKKGAQRVVLELADKLGRPATAGTGAGSTPAAEASADVIQALVGLGWNTKQAERATADARAEHPNADVATVLRAALRTLGSA